MVIASNISAMQANRFMSRANDRVNLANMRLSSGVRITSAKDDAAGLAIVNKLRMQLRGLNSATRNAADGISVVQTADGALNEMNEMVKRVQELAVQAANGTNTPDDRDKIQEEVDLLIEEITRTSETVKLNGVSLLNGSLDRANYFDTPRLLSTSYISPSVGVGTYAFDIISVGLPAAVDGSSYNYSGGMSGVIRINDETVSIDPGDDFNAAFEKIKLAAERGGIAVQDDGTQLYMYTERQGKVESISIGGDADLLAAFGITNTEVYGKDAVIDTSNLVYTKSDGTVDPLFSSLVSATTQGNKVTIKSADGFELQMNIQINYSLQPYEGDAASYGQPPNTITINETTGTGGSFPIKAKLNVLIEGPLQLQIGPDQNMSFDIQIPKLTSETLGIYRANVRSESEAQRTITFASDAESMILKIRSVVGAYQNRLKYTITTLDTTSLNTEESRSRIEDTDMGREMIEYSAQSVLVQAGISIIAQANSRPQQLLQLLQ